MSQLGRLSAVLLQALENEWPGAAYYATPELIYENAELVGENGAYVCQISTADAGPDISHLQPTVQLGHVVQNVTYEDINGSRIAKAEALAVFMRDLLNSSRNVTVSGGDYAGTYNTMDLIVGCGEMRMFIFDFPEYSPEFEDNPLFKWAAVSTTLALQPI